MRNPYYPNPYFPGAEYQPLCLTFVLMGKSVSLYLEIKFNNTPVSFQKSAEHLYNFGSRTP